jgi:hypothetical protein
MSEPELNTDMIRAIEALLSTARAGREVARTLSTQTTERQDRALISEMRSRRAERLREMELDAAERRAMGQEASDRDPSPWSRAG